MLVKKELLALPVVKSKKREGIIKAAAEILDIDGEKILHIDAVQDGEILVRYFADHEKMRWLVWGRKSGWSNMGLESAIDFELSSGCYRNTGWGRTYSIESLPDFDKKSKEIIEDYMSTSHRWWNTRTIEWISSWESEIRSEMRYKEQSKRQLWINNLMDAVPELPDDFMEWVKQTVFPEDFLMVKKEKKGTGFICTACRASGTEKISAKMGAMAACPRCGKQVKIKAMGRPVAAQRRGVVVLQTMTGMRRKRDPLYKIAPTYPAWVERQLNVEMEVLDNEKNLYVYEDIRAVIPQKEHWGTVYYGEDKEADPKHQGFIRSNPMNRRWKKSFLYPNNLQEVLPAAGLEHSGLKEMAMAGEPLDVNNFVIGYDGKPWIEYLIKAGLYNLVRDINDGNPSTRIQIKPGNNLQDCLGLNADGLNRLRQMNGNGVALAWLHTVMVTAKKISQESLEFFVTYNLSPNDDDLWKMYSYFHSPNKLANYIRKQKKLLGWSAREVVSEYRDYIDMCRRLKKQLDNEMVYKPKDLQAAHNACLALFKREKAGIRAEEVRRKYPEAELVLQMAQKYAYTGEEYMIIVPQKIEDIVVEGSTLGHCIDRTDIYFDRIQSRTSILAFLRKTVAPDAPWYTLEIEPGGTIRQKRTVGNNQKAEDIKAFTPFLREWQQYVKKMLSDEEKELAKASRETRLREYKELRDKKEPVRNGLLAGKLLVDVLEADLMEAM